MSKQSLVPVNASTEVKRAEEEIRGLNSPLDVLRRNGITSDGSYDAAGDLLRQVASVRKRVEAHRKNVTKHLDAAKKAVMGLFKPLAEQLDEAREDLERLMSGWEAKKEAEAREAEERERKKAEAQAKRLKTLAEKKLEEAEDPDEELEIRKQLRMQQDAARAVGAAKAEAIDKAPPRTEGVSAREVWDFEVVDIEQVPREFLRCEVSRSAVLNWIRRVVGDEAPSLPGLKFFKTKRRSVRT